MDEELFGHILTLLEKNRRLSFNQISGSLDAEEDTLNSHLNFLITMKCIRSNSKKQFSITVIGRNALKKKRARPTEYSFEVNLGLVKFSWGN